MEPAQVTQKRAGSIEENTPWKHRVTKYQASNCLEVYGLEEKTCKEPFSQTSDNLAKSNFLSVDTNVAPRNILINENKLKWLQCKNH